MRRHRRRRRRGRRSDRPATAAMNAATRTASPRSRATARFALWMALAAVASRPPRRPDPRRARRSAHQRAAGIAGRFRTTVSSARTRAAAPDIRGTTSPAVRPPTMATSDRPLRATLRELQSDPPLQPTPPRELPTASACRFSRGLRFWPGEKIEPAPTIGEQIAEIDRHWPRLGRQSAEQREDVDASAGQPGGRVWPRVAAGAGMPRFSKCIAPPRKLSRATTRFREFGRAAHAGGIRTEILRSAERYRAACSWAMKPTHSRKLVSGGER